MLSTLVRPERKKIAATAEATPPLTISASPDAGIDYDEGGHGDDDCPAEDDVESIRYAAEPLDIGRLDHDARTGGAPDSGEKGIPHTAGTARTRRGVQVPAMSTSIIEWSSRRRRRLAVELRASRW